MSAIEPGCVCVVIAGREAGLVVTAIEKVEPLQLVEIRSTLWRVSEPLRWEYHLRDGNVLSVERPWCEEHTLRRIDDWNEDQERSFCAEIGEENESHA